jgi:hypothetical protein
MAKREGQGLQIAVIAFAILTILLAVLTYVFYAQSATANKDLQAARKQVSELTATNNKLTYRALAMKYALGVGEVSKPEVDVAASAAGEDAEAKAVLDDLAAAVALVGDQAAPQGPQNYKTFVTVLMTSLARKNASLADLSDQLRQAQAAKEATEKSERERAQVAVAAADTAVKAAEQQSAQYIADRTKKEEESAKLLAQIKAVSDKAAADLKKLDDEKNTYVKAAATQRDRITDLQNRLKEQQAKEASLFEHPDGVVKLVNQQQKLVLIDVGRKDGLLRQTTFSVYDHDETGVTAAKSKAKIEVTSVGEDLSQARILEDTPSNPIIAGDVIFTPAWSPGQRVHFALAMKMDINKDRIDDYEMVKNIILMNGGVIDAELRPDGTRVGNISVGTRYFVEGERPSELTSPELMKLYTTFETDRERHGVEKISVEKLLSLMGWRAEVRTVELAGPRGSGDFRTRAPGKAQPAASSASPSDAAPASTSPPAAADADPFGGAAPAAPPATAPPAGADPFATPTTPSSPPADPFAP